MSSSGSSGDVYAETLAVFDQRDDPYEPFTTPEVADSLNTARRTVYKRLEKLVNRGDLKTKKVGANARIWWKSTSPPGNHTPKKAKHQRTEFESIVENVLERNTDGFYSLDEDLQFTYVNTRTEELLDLEESAVLSQNIHDTPLLTDAFEAALHEASETREPVIVEDYYAPFEVWFENAIYPSETGLSVYFRDISDRKRLEHDLQTERDHFRVVIENSPIVAFRMDSDLRYTWLYNPDQDFEDVDVTGKRDDELLPPETAEMLMAPKRAALETGEQVREERTYELPSGEVTYDLTVEPDRDETGEIDGISCVAVDITDQKQRERDLKRYERIVETVPDGVYALDSDDRFILINQAFCELVGYDRETLLGAHSTLIENQAVNDTANALQAEIQAGERDVGVIEAKFETATGETVPVESRIAPFEHADGRVGRCGVVRDVTEQIRREEELTALNRLNSVFQDVTHAIVESSSREEIEQTIAEHLTNSDSYEYAWIGHLDRHGERILPQIVGTNDVELPEIPLSSATDNSTSYPPAAEAMRTGRVQVTDDSIADPVLNQWKQSQDIRHRAGISIPIAYEERVHGVLNVYTARENAFDENERRIVRRISEVVGHSISAIERKRALLEDRVHEITFRSHRFTETLTDAAGDESFTVSIEKSVALPDDQSIAYYSLDGLDPAVFIDVIEQYNPDGEYHVTDEEGSRARVEVQQSNLTLAAELAKYNSWIADGTLQNGEFRLRVQVPQYAQVREVKDIVTEAYPDVEVLAQIEVERESTRLSDVFSDLDDQLTERQRTALEVAYYSGYFDWPRAITGEELAERLDVTPGTVSHHLRHGEHKLLSAFFDLAE
ncbi:putative PAS/PAC sensor protein (plasmid) [Haloterrigena turkmenica DSM 5511]|uniref:PAS/PAC sensor protein n=1 Tax=Haloterrigena turkmenica (strain ATCC 51198 / DSM 5511 / JCM 9101 / NCIMB 13204 / VKM B-1734 / 4k) TaxID=543526 RepID=D2S109_HALTV|nr:PAS domain-containing protein [Haloterrigena turkmenica]ADB63056.1 putative PAS/PAC sensor protein [Haloterrigena turkmenica DSM 5511]